MNGQANVYLAYCAVLLLFFIGLYDVWAAFRLPPGNTVSHVVYHWALAFPVLPFLIGLLLGHLLWPTGRH